MGRRRRIAEVTGHQPAGSLLGHLVVRELDLHGCSAAEDTGEGSGIRGKGKRGQG